MRRIMNIRIPPLVIIRHLIQIKINLFSRSPQQHHRIKMGAVITITRHITTHILASNLYLWHQISKAIMCPGCHLLYQLTRDTKVLSTHLQREISKTYSILNHRIYDRIKKNIMAINRHSRYQI